MTDTAVLRIDTVTTPDVPGLVGTPTQPIDTRAVAAVADAARARSAPYQRFIDAVSSGPIIGKPWVPDLVPPSGGGPQGEEGVVEKSEFLPTTISVTGQTETPILLGAVANISWQVDSVAGATIDALLREAALRAAVEVIVATLADGAPSVPDIPTAVMNLEAFGWPVGLIAGLTGELVKLDVGNYQALGVTVLGGIMTDKTIVASPAGIWCQVSEADLRRVEPSIGGVEASAMVDVVAKAAENAVMVVPIGGP